MQKTSTFDLRPTVPIFENCPACQKEIAPDQKECFSCGIVFSNFAKFQFERDLKAKVGGIDHLSIEALKSLDQRWKRLVVNYHDQDAHQAFVRRCFVEEAIPFAVFCYSRMLEIDGEDDIASLMRKQALQLLTVKMETAPPQEAPLPRPSRLFQWAIWTGLFVSTLIVAMGLAVPQLHNLTGLGVSLLFVFLFAQIYRRRFFS